MRFSALVEEKQCQYRIANLQITEGIAQFDLFVADSQKWETIQLRQVGGDWFLQVDQGKWVACVVDPIRKRFFIKNRSVQWFEGFIPSGLNEGGDAGIKTDMPCKVVEVLVNAGDEVTKGQPVLILEAMKMENEIKSPRDGVIDSVLVKKGQALEADVVLLEFSENQS